MDSAAPPVPADIAIFPNGQLGVAWSDGHESIYDGYALRCACPCAACVDEMTGRKILKDELVPRSVRPVRVEPVGRYAVSIVWSDGHDTGIYTFENLRGLCPCDACRR